MNIHQQKFAPFFGQKTFLNPEILKGKVFKLWEHPFSAGFGRPSINYVINAELVFAEQEYTNYLCYYLSRRPR